MARQVAEGVYRLGTRWVNWYLVRDGEHITVIDTGLPQYVDQLAPALARLGCRLGDVDAIRLTHRHYDVLGSAPSRASFVSGLVVIAWADAALLVLAAALTFLLPRRAA